MLRWCIKKPLPEYQSDSGFIIYTWGVLSKINVNSGINNKCSMFTTVTETLCKIIAK